MKGMTMDKEKIEEIEEIIDVICKAPDSQIDKDIVVELKELKGLPWNEMAEKLDDIIGRCVYASLVSGFALTALNVLHKQVKEIDGESPMHE